MGVFWCSEYDEINPHWCDPMDGYWKDSKLNMDDGFQTFLMQSVTCQIQHHTGDHTERLPGVYPGDHPGDHTERLPGGHTSNHPGDHPDDHTEHLPGVHPGDHPGDHTDHLPGVHPGDHTEHLPGVHRNDGHRNGYMETAVIMPIMDSAELRHFIDENVDM